jgi:polyhydroxybutyrate depolymerase
MIFKIVAFCFVFLSAVAFGNVSKEKLLGRDAFVYVPSHLASSDHRALVVVLHGGMGKAENIISGRAESPLNFNSLAEKEGFVAVYLNGTPVTRFAGDDKLGWNAGKCCGLPAMKSVDDVAYISQAVATLVKKYGIDPKRVYGIGHSNGAMMTQRMICETDIYAAAVAISGPLMTESGKCPRARGKRVLSIHGADDKNVPLEGGRGTQGCSVPANR